MNFLLRSIIRTIATVILVAIILGLLIWGFVFTWSKINEEQPADMPANEPQEQQTANPTQNSEQPSLFGQVEPNQQFETVPYYGPTEPLYPLGEQTETAQIPTNKTVTNHLQTDQLLAKPELLPRKNQY